MSGAVAEIIGGRYRVRGLLGEGAMGAVYRAEQLDSEGHALREVALKTIRSELSRDPTFARRFLLEARVAARLESPHVVTIFESGQAEDGRLYFSMELVRAPTLKEVIQREGPLAPGRVVEIASQICEALAAAHGSRESIVHRDLKPANVFLAQKFGRDWVKVGDFGIAKVLGDESSGLTGTGHSLGTPRYMAPEQWRGEQIDGRADLYSLGVLMHELLTGSAPFAGSVETLMYRHLHEPPPRLPPSVPEGVRRIVESLLSKDSAERPASALDLRTRLEALSRGSEGETLTLAETSGRPDADGDPTAVISLPPQGDVKKPARSKWLGIGAGVFLASGLVLAGLRYLPPLAKEESRPTPVAQATPDLEPIPTAAPSRSTEPLPTIAASPTSAPEPIAAPLARVEPGLELELHPPGSPVEIDECMAQTFSARSREPGVEREWSVNGERHGERGERLEFTARERGQHRIRVVTRLGEKERAHEWEVRVKPRPPTSDEVDRWISDYGEALERRDVSLLRKLGEVRSDEDADAWEARLAGRRDYEVRLENLQVELHPDRARLTFERSERWKDSRNPGFVLDFASEAKTLVRESCRLVSGR